MPDHPNENAVIAIKKYPNRRYYDSNQSRHVTLEDIHRMIRAGQQVRVTDSKTDADITSRVLAQIILEMDSLKLSLFPSPLLHKLIQSNETVVHEFVEIYFNRALDWFLTSRQVFEDRFRQAMGLTTPGDNAGAAPPIDTSQSPPLFPTSRPPSPHTTATHGAAAELHDRVDNLSKRVEDLQAQLLKSSRNGR